MSGYLLVVMMAMVAAVCANPCYYVYEVQRINSTDVLLDLQRTNDTSYKCAEFTYRIEMIDSGKVVYTIGDSMTARVDGSVRISTKCFKWMPWPFEGQLYPCSVNDTVGIHMSYTLSNTTVGVDDILYPISVVKEEDLRNILLSLVIWIPIGCIVVCGVCFVCVCFVICYRYIRRNYMCC